MPTAQRGRGPVSPRDLTGRLYQQQQKAVMDKSNAPRDIEEELHKAYQRGHEAGLYEGIRWVQENYDVFELEDEDEIGIEGN